MTTEISSTHTAPVMSPVRGASMGSLFLVSSAALYLEIVLIRWLGTEVKIFAFFQNLSLIVCFLGFGVGCFSSSKRGSLMPSLVSMTILVAMVSLPIAGWHRFLQLLSSVLSFTPDAALWGQGLKFPPGEYFQFLIFSLIIVAAFLMLLVSAMIPLGRWVGYCLETAPNTVTAYSVNLLGSLVGIWLLAILALFWLSPPYWFGVAFLLILVSRPTSWKSWLLGFGLFAVILLSLRPERGKEEYWSPYQKLAVTAIGNQQYEVDVNNEGYMTIANLTPEYLAQNPDLAKQYQGSSYDSPFGFVQSVNRVLVVGSGAGNDVAAALRHGAAHVDAVEIDPMISTLGKRLHPEQPYGSPKVHLINNDARNYMRQCKDKYDVVIFGLLDSHTEFSGYSNVRVDNYVYTEQSFREAQRLLNPDGILILKFEVRNPWTWMGQRFYSMLGNIFGRPPVAYYVPKMGGLLDASVFIESNSPQLWATSSNEKMAAFLNAHPTRFSPAAEKAPAATTDDWPYVYHFGHSIPRAYFTVSAVILIMVVYLVGPFFKPKESGSWNLFLLGGGFLLMETQLVSRLALYFGTTWLVNCIALSGVLSVLLLANFVVEYRRPRNLRLFYILLVASLIADYAIPWSSISSSGRVVGSTLCVAFCIPIFIAGIIFTETFRRVGGRSYAFGANMLGAVMGGLAQNLSFIFGMKALLLIAAVIYGGAALLQLVRPINDLSLGSTS